MPISSHSTTGHFEIVENGFLVNDCVKPLATLIDNRTTFSRVEIFFIILFRQNTGWFDLSNLFSGRHLYITSLFCHCKCLMLITNSSFLPVTWYYFMAMRACHNRWCFFPNVYSPPVVLACTRSRLLGVVLRVSLNVFCISLVSP